MKRFFYVLLFSVTALCFCACTPVVEVTAEPASLESFGYEISFDQIPEEYRDKLVVRHRSDYDTDWQGDFTELALDPSLGLTEDCSTVLFLQAVPANTTYIQLSPSEKISTADWGQYHVFSNTEIMVFDLYPLWTKSEETLPQRAADSLPADCPVNLNAVWESCHTDMDSLIQKIPSAEE